MSLIPLSTVPIRQNHSSAVVEEIETFEAEADAHGPRASLGRSVQALPLQYGIYGQRQAGVQMSV